MSSLNGRIAAFNWLPWNLLLSHDWWIGTLIFWVITPVGLWLVRGVVQGIWVNPLKYDWMSFNCDVFLGIGFGAMLQLGQSLPASSKLQPEWLYWTVSVGSIVFWVGWGIVHWFMDLPQIGLKRSFGATSLYHFPIHLLVGYPMTYLFAVTVSGVPWNTPLLVATHLAPFICTGLWVAGMVYDFGHPNAPNGQPKFDYTSPIDGWRNVRRLWGVATG